MAEIKLFDTWTFQEEMPEPFSRFLQKEGLRKTTTMVEWLSQYNQGRQATLHPSTLRAMLNIAGIYLKQTEGALGFQKGNYELLNFYCMEYVKGRGRYALVYNPISAKIRGICKTEKQTYKALDFVERNVSDGEEVLAMLIYVSLEKKEALYNLEFAQNFILFMQQMKEGWKNAKLALKAAFLCCDNLYRRVENVQDFSNEGIPLEKSQLGKAGMEQLSTLAIESELYAPNDAIKGTFQILGEMKKEREWTLKELQKIYRQHWSFPKDYENRIPQLPEDMKVGEYAQDILSAIVESPFRKFMITGNAGTGKTTDAQMVAQILGVPYFALNCGPETDESTLVAGIYPNSRKKTEDSMKFPSLQEFVTDPMQVLEEVAHTRKEGITKSEAFRELLDAVYQSGYQKAKNEGDFVMQESEIIKGCRMPSVIEIMEASLIVEPGTLGKLNRLLDDSRKLDLLYGEVVERHPNAIIIITTNLNYVANREFDFSVVSRMNKVQHRKDLTEQQLAERAMFRTGCKDMEVLKQMAKVMKRLDAVVKEEFGKAGLCGYREYENWVYEYMRTQNLVKAAEDTVLSKLASDEEDRDMLRQVCMEIYVEQGKGSV
nr:MAG TPA: AAA+ domain protein [Caudoviricetes sp.]